MATMTTDMLKVPPHDAEAEKSVLGAILIDSSAIVSVAHILQDKHFYVREHQLLYRAMVALYEKQQPIDAITLKSELHADKELKNAGGISYIAALINSVPTAANIEHYARIVHNLFLKRRLIEISTHTVDRVFDSTSDAQTMLDSVEEEIFALAETASQRDFIALKTLLTESYSRLEDLSKSDTHLRGVPTGYHELDMKLAGMQESNLLILAARPGVGKTSLALNMALHVAMKEKMPVAFFSLEMSKEELVDRLLVAHADIDSWRLKTGRLSPDDYTSLTEAMGDLADAPIYIDDTAGSSVLEMRTKARKLKSTVDIKFIIVDYLQLVDAGRKIDSREQQVSYVSQNLKNLARELKVPVLAISQLNRMVEQRGSKKPQLADLRESGAIEQDADVVMFLYQEGEGEDIMDVNKKIIKLSIAKHRNGAIGEIDFVFRGDRVKFYSVEKNVVPV